MAIRVLIVDDHSSFRRLARRMLSAAGFVVVGEAIDAASALTAAASLQPDVVLLDIVLPDRSGLLVAEQLVRVADPPRVVLISSRSRSDFGPSFVLAGWMRVHTEASVNRGRADRAAGAP